MKNKNLFTIITQILVIVLPFYVFLSLFFTNILGIKYFGFFIKEFLIVVLFFSLIYEFYKAKKLPKLDSLDYLIAFYILYGVIITLINGLGLDSIIHGGRYDFMFLIVMLIYKHGYEFLKVSRRKIMLLFLYSGAMALLVGFALKFRFKEEFLLEFGYVDYVGSRVYTGGIPVYHGLENSGIRRFQGIFDGPNAMAFFLILFSGVFLYLQKKKNEYYVYLSVGFLFWLLLMTYSRSAIAGAMFGAGIVFLLNIKKIYKEYTKVFLGVAAVGLILMSIGGVIYYDKLVNIVIRPSSTEGHFSRMKTGIERFTEKPFGAGLAESGPAYRYIYPDKQTKEDEVKYIPESWFIQVLIEGGILYFIVFSSIMGIVLWRLYKNSPIFFAVLIAILFMNMFLHSFEITYISILTFIFIGLFLKNDTI